MSAKVTEFELIDHGIDNPQYFQGCGTSFTRFSHVVTGVADNPREALDDALEQIAMGEPSVDTEDLFARIIDEEGDNEALVTDEDGSKQFPETPSGYEDMMTANGCGEGDEPDEDDEEAHDAWEESRESFDGESNYYHISIRYNV